MNEIITLPGVQVTPTALIIPEGLPFEEWEILGNKLRVVNNASKWLLGDWLNYGEKSYGEMYTQALEASDYDYGTLRNKAWVCRKFEMSRRVTSLSFAHHQEVAALDQGEADILLEQAEKENWTRSELRARVREDKQLPTPKIICPECGAVFEK